MKILVFCYAVIAVVSCTDSRVEQAHDMRDLMKKVVNKYQGEEGVQRLMRRSTSSIHATLREFQEFITMVDEINADPTKPYSAEYNEISIMSAEQKKALLGMNESLFERELVLQERSEYETESIRAKRQSAEPTNLCWVRRGAQPDVKNQLKCGSCYAFGAVSSLEGFYYIVTGEKKTFAEQEYVDCVLEDKPDRNGCKGAWQKMCFTYNKDKDRMAELKDAPYLAKDNVCDYSNVPNGLTKAKVTGYKFVRGTDATLQTAVNSGVVTVSIRVRPTWSAYRSGVYTCTESECNEHINHAVTVIGYGVTVAGLKYWDVRNSWGGVWGDGGYIKMTRDDAIKNIINIHKYSIVPVLECRAGQTCKTPEWDDSDFDYSDDRGETDKGKNVQCGKIAHYGGRCLSIDDSADKYVDLSSVCERTWCLTDKGYLYETATDMCANVKGHRSGLKLKLGETCSTKWDITTGNSFKNRADGRCMHPSGGKTNPPESTNVVAWTNCDEDSLTFKFIVQICWEVEAGKSLTGNIQAVEAIQNLADAKEACMENDECKGLNYDANQDVYTLKNTDIVVSSTQTGDKALTIVNCDKACNKGEERCNDGDCREECGDEGSSSDNRFKINFTRLDGSTDVYTGVYVPTDKTACNGAIIYKQADGKRDYILFLGRRWTVTYFKFLNRDLQCNSGGVIFAKKSDPDILKTTWSLHKVEPICIITNVLTGGTNYSPPLGSDLALGQEVTAQCVCNVMPLEDVTSQCDNNGVINPKECSECPDGCPNGTMMCDDGVCRHEHMC